MIIREWRGRADAARTEAYAAHFRTVVLPNLQRVAGFAGACLCQRRLGFTVEILVLTRWRSMEALRGFAGATVEKAVVEPGAAAALIDFDAVVQHYEVVEEVPPPADGEP